MLGFDQEFQNGTSRITKVWLNFTLSDGTSLEFHEDRVLFNGFVRDTSTTVDGQFTVGAAVTGKLTLNLDNTDDALSRYDFRGATVIAWLGGEKTDGTFEKVNAGRYYIDEYTYDGSNVTLVGYDDMVKFDIPCKDTTIGSVWHSTLTPGYLINAISYYPEVRVPLYNSPASLPNPLGDPLTYAPKQLDTMTLHDVVSACCQVMGLYAHIVYVPGTTSNYQLKLDWYDTSQLTSNQYDGGTFDTATTPYSDGATLDGGSFDPWNTGDVADGGAFGDRTGVHIIPSPYDLTVDTDDVQITGVSVILEPTDNINADDNTKTYTKTLGTEGYIIQITGNPFIDTTSRADSVCTYLNGVLTGMRFRPLSASVIENPAMEAGDVAIITGKDENTYNCFLSRVTYSVNAATQVSCDAESSMQNLKSRYSGAQKIQAMVQRVASERAVSNAETAMHSVLSSYAASMGLYPYTESDGQGGTIYTYGNKNTLAASDIRWRFAAGALTVSNDYGQTWTAGLSADGVAVLSRLYAVGINADYINAGNLTLGGREKNVNGNFYLKDAEGNTIVTMNKRGIFNGKTNIKNVSNTGFYLSNDGLIIGDGPTLRYARITPDGIVYIHDNPYYSGEGDEVETVPSFIVEGLDANGNLVHTSIFSDGIETGEITAKKVSVNVVFEGDCPVIPSALGSEDYIRCMSIFDTGVVSQPVLRIVLENGNTYDVETALMSDKSLKKDIKESNINALNIINSIKHRAFRWKKNNIENKNGYIAQELQNVIPSAIHPVKQGDGSELLQIRTAEIIPYLSKAIQELSAKVDALETRLAELEGR